mmetsp:Transcript_19177/g.43618  ORF Transcript_19177/g.43618 Transcript_19177/m.43618 type:complete len:206 (+) Transcript_19177:44-661(+)
MRGGGSLLLPRHRDAGECTGREANVAIAVGLACPNLLVLQELVQLLHEAVAVQARGQHLLLDVVAAQPPEDALPAIHDLGDLAQHLRVHVRHQHEVAMVLVDVVVKHPDVVVAELQLRPLLAGVHHEREVAEALVQLLQVHLAVLRRNIQLATEHAVRLLRKLAGRSRTGVFRPVLLLAPEVVPPNALLLAALGLPEEDADLAVL